jgi:hypothetical protein
VVYNYRAYEDVKRKQTERQVYNTMDHGEGEYTNEQIYDDIEI